jgi:hypothetical protein
MRRLPAASQAVPDLCAPCLDPLLQAGRAWLRAGRPAEAEWPFQQLRERLAALQALSCDACAEGEARCAAQLLQFHALQGSMVLAARAGHQALWSNLVARMQLLLDACLLPPASTAVLCQELADTLVGQAASAAAASGPSAPVAAAASRQPTLLLQCAKGLIAHSSSLVQALAAAAAAGVESEDTGGALGRQEAHSPAELEAWLGQLHGSLLEVRGSWHFFASFALATVSSRARQLMCH